MNASMGTLNKNLTFMKNYIDFKLKKRKGIDDLKPLFVFDYWGDGESGYGSNDLTKYLVAKENNDGWNHVSFDGSCALTQEAINAEIKQREIWNKAYVEQLKNDGEYGNEHEQNWRVQTMDAFDKPSSGDAMSGFGMIIPQNKNNTK